MRRLAALLFLISPCLLVAWPATATVESPTPLGVRIEQVTVDPDGTTRLTVAVSGLPAEDPASLDALEIVENGETVTSLEVATREVLEGQDVVPAVVLALDTSGSTAGEPIEAAMAAASDLLVSLESSGAAVGVVGFGAETVTLAPLSRDADEALAAVSQLEADGETALYDGVARAARMLAGAEGPTDIVVFSDGEDTVSATSLDELRALLSAAEVRVTSVLLQSEDVAVAPLQAIADVNGGRFIEVTEAAELAGAFSAIAGDLTNRLQVVWEAEPVANPAPTLSLVATYRSGDRVASDGVQVDSPRLAAVTPPREVQVPAPLAPALTGDVGAVVAAVAGGIALLLVLFLALSTAGEHRRRSALEGRLKAYQPHVGERGRGDDVSLSDRASRALDVLPRPASLDSRIAVGLEQADWPLRVSEFLLLSGVLCIVGIVSGGVLFGSGIAAVVAGLLGLVGPWSYLRVAIRRRRSDFAEQLPTVLQVLAGALRAGHALATALDGVVDEVDEPARSELRRASVEARLGRPLDRALAGVAERMDSVDLQWVIGAIEVQREVGGNLAEILSNVAATLRDRASIGRHVQALTAEGRLSATLISAMPFAMFVFLSVSNPDYVRPLYAEPIGRVMLTVGGVLLLIGIFVLRRLVEPKY